jgi:protein-tyrosine phosphatase
MTTVDDAQWIELEGAANARDVGGLPAGDGRRVVPNRLIRSDNLQTLTSADVHRLVHEHDVRTVVDLRTGREVESEGPGPMIAEPSVRVENLSLFPEAGHNTDAAAAENEDEYAPTVLVWQRDDRRQRAEQHGPAGYYLGYLQDRPDSIIAALRVIATGAGATIVHCAAGKDRTGVVVALALAEVGVTRDAIVADYARSGERIEGIFARLAVTRTYANDVADVDYDKHRPQAETMRRFLELVDEIHGGARSWLRDHGWTEDDAEALRSKLLVR